MIYMFGFLIAGTLATLLILYLLTYHGKNDRLLKFITTVIFVLIMFLWSFMVGYAFGQKDQEIGLPSNPFVMQQNFKEWRVR